MLHSFYSSGSKLSERLSSLFNSMISKMVESGLKFRSFDRTLCLSSGLSLFFGVSPFHGGRVWEPSGGGLVVVGGCSEGEN